MKCKKCGGSGIIHYKKDIDGRLYDFSKECECVKADRIKKRQLQHIRESGLEEQLSGMTFSNYERTVPQQLRVYEMAVENTDALNWFFIGGNSGTGKTHILTAMAGEIIAKGKELQYHKWREVAMELKALMADFPSYVAKMKKLQKVEVLCLDDFFKGSVTESDKNLAFSLIDYRYAHKLKTIISSELSLEQILSIDEAIAGRIFERCGGSVLKITGVENLRLKSNR